MFAESLNRLFLIFIGGGIGAVLRFVLSMGAIQFKAPPWVATSLVNLAGTSLFFLISQSPISVSSSLFMRTGILGALTTFSTFTFDVVSLYKEGQMIQASMCLLLNVVFGIVIGIWLFQKKAI